MSVMGNGAVLLPHLAGVTLLHFVTDLDPSNNTGVIFMPPMT